MERGRGGNLSGNPVGQFLLLYRRYILEIYLPIFGTYHWHTVPDPGKIFRPVLRSKLTTPVGKQFCWFVNFPLTTSTDNKFIWGFPYFIFNGRYFGPRQQASKLVDLRNPPPPAPVHLGRWDRFLYTDKYFTDMGEGKVCTKWSTAKLLNYLNISNIRAFYSLRQIWAESRFSFQSYTVVIQRSEIIWMKLFPPSLLPPSISITIQPSIWPPIFWFGANL